MEEDLVNQAVRLAPAVEDQHLVSLVARLAPAVEAERLGRSPAVALVRAVEVERLGNKQAVGLEVKALNPIRHQEAVGSH